ncbi:MAG TPA: SDR family NAD(P)-dependent oxidoreductase [Anaerolineae bacterium]
MFDFTDQVAVVTGAAGNLGEAVAHAFYAAGARLVLVNRSMERLEATFADLADSERCLFAAVDLTDASAVEGMVYETVTQFGRVDILTNLAGGYKGGPLVHETPVETWEFMLNLNARTTFLASRAVIPHMLQQGQGKLVSVAARAGLEGKARMAAYVVSKSAVIRLTESMAAELKHKGINVNCVLPGTIDTPQNRRDMPNADFSKWVPAEDIASVILFLASDAARAIQGAAIPVYGRS